MYNFKNFSQTDSVVNLQ